MAFSASSLPLHAAVFINEIHYDDSTGSGDVGERVEVVATNGETLTDYRIVLYNGSNGSQYDDDAVPEGSLRSCGGMVRIGVVSYPTNGLQNGAPDGIALVGPGGTVVQFLSYEGSFTANGGPANGMTATDIGVSETNSTAPGTSLQLSGNGATYSDFSWQDSRTESFGECNSGQTFAAGVDVPPAVASSEPSDGSANVPVSSFLQVTFSEPVSTSSAAFSLVCAAIPQPLALSGGPLAYTLTPQTDLPVGASCTLTVVATGVLDQDGTADAMAADRVINFSTAQDLPPSLASSSPADGATGVPRATSVLLTFSEPVAVSPPLASMQCTESGSVALALTGGPVVWTLDPSAELEPLETCSVTVLAVAVSDLDGSPDPLAADAVISFTTSAGAGDYYVSVTRGHLPLPL